MDDKLPIKKIFLSAISLPGLYHSQLIKIGWPLLLIGAISIITEHLTIGGDDSYIDEIIGVTLAISMVITLVMAIVGCHRLFIFGPKEENEYQLFEWTGNEIKYSGWWILIGFITGIIAIPFMLVLVPLVQNGFEGLIENQSFYYIVMGLVNIPIYYFISRWSLVLPASATDTHGKSLSWSWDLSSNYAWSLTFLIGILPFSTDLLFGLLPEDQSIIIDFITSSVWIVIGVIEIGLLSLSYSFIKSRQPEDTVGT